MDGERHRVRDRAERDDFCRATVYCRRLVGTVRHGSHACNLRRDQRQPSVSHASSGHYWPLQWDLCHHGPTGWRAIHDGYWQLARRILGNRHPWFVPVGSCLVLLPSRRRRQRQGRRPVHVLHPGTETNGTSARVPHATYEPRLPQICTGRHVSTRPYLCMGVGQLIYAHRSVRASLLHKASCDCQMSPLTC